MPTVSNHRRILDMLRRQDAAVNRIYGQLAARLGSVLQSYRITEGSVWSDNEQVRSAVYAEFRNFRRMLFSHIGTQMVFAWGMANNDIDDLVNDYIGSTQIPDNLREVYFQRNEDAISAFVQRGEVGDRLSDRITRLSTTTRVKLQLFLQEGLSEGRSASQLAGDIRSYLREPNRRFRRVRDENGRLQLSTAAQRYRPGRGVYRSSHANAVRIARNEINNAYREADRMRREQLDFVTGVRINLSPSHPRYDICDELVGDYPKGTIFTGFHPNCLCYTTSKLLPKSQFARMLRGQSYRDNSTTDVPNRAARFIGNNAAAIRRRPPNFIRDNFVRDGSGFRLRSRTRTRRSA